VVELKNPYQILEIEQNATNKQIELARKHQLKTKCGVDENRKNEEGEYLQEVINQAAEDLLNPEKRKEIDEKLNKKLDVPILRQSIDSVNAQIVITTINRELVEKMPQMKFEKRIFSKKVKCDHLFLIVLENSGCLFAREKHSNDKWWLHEFFTDRFVTDGFEAGDCPWDQFEVFECDGIPAIAYPSYQILPISIIRNQRVRENALRNTYPVIQNSVIQMESKISQLFEEAKVKTK